MESESRIKKIIDSKPDVIHLHYEDYLEDEKYLPNIQFFNFALSIY